MTFAPFPPATYLADGSRTEGEMKTAFENWLLATKQTGGHGQCRLQFASSTGLLLVPHEGRRVLLSDQSYEVPTGGAFVTNVGLLANATYLVVLSNDVDVITLKLWYHGAGAALRVIDPDSGISMVSFDGGTTPSRNTTVVGMIRTDASAQFFAAGVCSLHGRLPKMEDVSVPTDFSGGSATYAGLLSLTVPVFIRDTVSAHGTLFVRAQPAVAALVQAVGKFGSTTMHGALWSVPANSTATLNVTWPMLSPWDGELGGELGLVVFSGGPVTVLAGTRLLVSRLG